MAKYVKMLFILMFIVGVGNAYATHSTTITIIQALKHILIMDGEGHIPRGYYEDNFSSVVDGYGWLDDSSTSAGLAGFMICGFNQSLSGQMVTVTSDTYTSKIIASGTYAINGFNNIYDLTGANKGTQYCIYPAPVGAWDPHSGHFPYGNGKILFSSNGHSYTLSIKVVGNKNYDHCHQ